MSVAYKKTIVCLANSRKISGRCIAGLEIEGESAGHWIRPVSSRATGELSEADRQFQDGGDPRMLDVVTICMREPRPHGHQAENHLIDDKYYWVRRRQADWTELVPHLEKGADALWSDNSSTYHGINDRVAAADASKLGNSLKLIEVGDLRVRVLVEGAAFGDTKQKVRGQFTFGGTVYRLMVTDPAIERRFKAQGEGEYDLGGAALCVSLGEVHEDGFAYKLVAGVILSS